MSAVPARAPSVAARAALVAVLLVLFYVLAAAAFLGLVAVAVLSFRNGLGSISGKLALVAGFVGLALARAIFAVEKSSHQDLPGRAVSRAQEPELWRLVDEVAAGLGTRPPDELRLIDDVNAFVTQDARLLGLVPGRRTMAVGMALLHTLNVDELRAVLAHEFGHFTGGDTRLGPLTYRATATVRRAVQHLGPKSILGRLFGLYAVLVYRTSLAVRRRQEVSADVAAASRVGRETHESALRSVHAGAAAYGFFLDRYVAPLLDSGVRPADLFAGYADLLDDPKRAEELAALRQEVDAAPADPYDSHPSLGERLAVLQALPAAGAAQDDRWAVEVLADPAAASRRATQDMLGHLTGMQVVADFTAAAPAYAQGGIRAGQSLLAVVPQLDGGPAPAALGRVLDLVEQGRGSELVVAFTRDRRTAEDPARDVADTLARPLAALAEEQLVAKGKARYALNWGGPLQVLGARDAEVDLGPEIHAALLDPSLLPRLRRSLARKGIELGAAVEGGLAPAERDDVTMVLPAARIDGSRGARADLLLTYEALLVAQYAHQTGRTAAVRRAYREAADEEKALEAARNRLRPLRDATPAQIASLEGVTRYVWDDLVRVVLGRGSKDGKVFAISLLTEEGAEPVSFAVVDSPVHHDVVLERLLVLVGGERLYVSES